MSALELKKLLALLTTMAVLPCGCGGGEDIPAGGADSAPPAVAPHEAASVPKARRARDAAIPFAQSTGEMLAALSHEDRKLTESFYAEFGREAFEFANAKEHAWMARHGYPLPEDIIQANRLTDAELQARLDAGDAKAGLFLLDRMARRAQGASSLAGSGLAERLLKASGPFAGYAYYRYFREVRGRRAQALAGLLWAFQQGDWRAGQLFSRELRTGGPFGEVLVPGEIAMAYVALLSDVGVIDPTGRRVDPLIVYHSER